MRPDGPRDPIAGPDEGPASPFPLRISGKVIKGFGRGSKELGIPTANIPLSGISIDGKELDSGIYYGWAGLSSPPSPSSTTPSNSASSASTPARRSSISERIASSLTSLVSSLSKPSGQVYPMVMSVGWNPYYKNSVRSAEIHIIHRFSSDFYGHDLHIVILGFIRPEYDYVSLESLIEDINEDIEVTKRSLARDGYAKYKEDGFLLDFPQENREDEKL